MLLLCTGLYEDYDQPRRHPLAGAFQRLIELHGVPELLRPHTTLDDELVHTFIKLNPHPAQLLIDGEHLLDVVNLACAYELGDEAIGVISAALCVLVAWRASARLLPSQHLRWRGAPWPDHSGVGLRRGGSRLGVLLPRGAPRGLQLFVALVEVPEPVVRLLGRGRVGSCHRDSRRALSRHARVLIARGIPAHGHSLLNEGSRGMPRTGDAPTSVTKRGGWSCCVANTGTGGGVCPRRRRPVWRGRGAAAHKGTGLPAVAALAPSTARRRSVHEGSGRDRDLASSLSPRQQRALEL
mmetsp:Transcript_18125/g.56893  ORF Transcript_18125/g.56893 Transcript_18125/m.56893 type:complete len:296 (-) Transcript_18125:437-1324(-)